VIWIDQVLSADFVQTLARLDPAKAEEDRTVTHGKYDRHHDDTALTDNSAEVTQAGTK
jgi:hypothetical protein